MTSDDSHRRRLVVSVTDGEGRPRAAAGLGAWLAAIAPASARGTLAIALVDDDRVRGLNRKYRRKDFATDVLSFPDGADGFLGDIVIATGVARRQAREQRHSYRAELRTLALHGLLHLLGYDHETDHGQMRRIEEKLRIRSGLSGGLISRTSKAADMTTRGRGSARAGGAKRRRHARARSARRVSDSSALGVGPQRAVKNAGGTPRHTHRARNRQRRPR